MAWVFNPFTGNLDQAGGGGGTPGGDNTQIQFNDNGSFGVDAEAPTYNKTTNLLTTKGDISLDDGVAGFTTTLQTVTPTANRVVSIPNNSGTLALVAGVSGSLIYNNAGAYAGLSNFTTDGTNVTISGRWTNSTNGAQSLSPVQVTGAWYGHTGNNTPIATGSTAYPALYISPAGTSFGTTWATGGTGIGVNAPASFAGNLIDMRVNGSSAFSVNNTASATSLSLVHLNGGGGITFAPQTNGGTLILVGGIYGYNVSSSNFTLSNATGFSWSSGQVHNTSIDLSVIRDAANTLAQRNGTSAQKTNIYDTFTSVTDYHRVTIATARATLSAVSGASVTAIGLIPAGAVVMGVTSKVTTALGTANGTTGYKIGTAADDDRWGAITGTAAGTTSDNRNWTAGTIECFPAATDVIVTATGGNFNATGVIYLSVQYMAGEAD